MEGRGPTGKRVMSFSESEFRSEKHAFPFPCCPPACFSEQTLSASWSWWLLPLLMPGVRISSDSSNGSQGERGPVSSPASPHPRHVSVPHNFSLVTLDLVRSNSVGYLSHRQNLRGHFIPPCLVQRTLCLSPWETAGFCVNPGWPLQQRCRLEELQMPHRLQILLFSSFHRGDNETDPSAWVGSHHRTACRIQSCGKGSLRRLYPQK